LNANLAFHSGDAEASLGDVEVDANLPGKALQGLLPQAERLGGSVGLRLARKAGKGRFTLDTDLTRLDLAMGHFFEKRPGEAIQLRLSGPAADAWSVETIQATANDAKLALRSTEAGWAAPDLDLDLAAWSFLLVEGASASGRLRGAIDPQAGTTKLQLEKVAVALSPTLRLDSADGEVDFAGKNWTATGLRLRGARSDAVLDAMLRDGRIEGKLTGANLDVDVARTLIDQVREWLPEDDPNEPPSVRWGELGVRLERIAFGRGEARNAHATLRWVDGNLQAHDIAFETYEGRVTGTVDLNARQGAPSQLALDLDVDGVTGRFIDDLFSAEPRGVRGTFNGKIQFDAPLHDDAKMMWANANGRLAATGTEGSFGKLGLATQLTTVLRSSEALRLRLPAMKDEGLVFDSFHTDVTMKDGRAEITTLTLDSTAYAATAKGYLDFRRDESRVPIVFDAVKGITGFLGRIPVAGEALKLVSVRLTGTGSPFDLKVGIASVTDHVVGATMVGPNAVIGGVRDVTRVLRKSGNGGEATPTPDATASPADSTAAPVPAEATPPAPVPESSTLAPAPVPESPTLAPAPAPAPEAPATPPPADGGA
jgi:uncharacterized protein YhdP